MPEPGQRPDPSANPCRLTIALTGGIAAGKSAVADRFAALGVPIIDTDVIARDLVRPGQPALAQVVDAFGERVLADDGSLDRRCLREIVFGDPVARARLEAILHPRIRAAALEQVAGAKGPYCIIVIPLLAESGGFPGIDRVLLVDTEPAVQLARVMDRDGVSEAQARAALAAQASRETRLALADDVIDNSGPLEGLDERVEALHRKYTRLAAARTAP